MPVFNDTAYIAPPMLKGQRSLFFPSGFIVGDENSHGYLIVTTVSLMSVDSFSLDTILVYMGAMAERSVGTAPISVTIGLVCSYV